MNRRNFLGLGISFIAGAILGIFVPKPKGRKPSQPRRTAPGKVVLGEGCVGCGGCPSTCPAFAVELFHPQLIVHPERCISCGNCQKVCPVGAIRLAG